MTENPRSGRRKLDVDVYPACQEIMMKRKCYTKLLWMLILLALFGPVQAAKAAESIVGRWAGTVFEKKVGNYTVYVEIHSNQKTGVVHFLRYPCGGTLFLESKTGQSHLYRERLTFGQKKCVNNLHSRITWKAPNLVYFEEIIKGSSNVYGTLKRIIDVTP